MLAQEGHAFRNELESDPRSALKKLPIEITGVRFPEKIQLPRPSHFSDLLERIESDEFADPSIPAGYCLFMLVLPFGCPTAKERLGRLKLGRVAQSSNAAHEAKHLPPLPLPGRHRPRLRRDAARRSPC